MWDDIDLVPSDRRREAPTKRAADRKGVQTASGLDRPTIELILLVLAALVAGLLGLVA